MVYFTIPRSPHVSEHLFPLLKAGLHIFKKNTDVVKTTNSVPVKDLSFDTFFVNQTNQIIDLLHCNGWLCSFKFRYRSLCVHFDKNSPRRLALLRSNMIESVHGLPYRKICQHHLNRSINGSVLPSCQRVKNARQYS